MAKGCPRCGAGGFDGITYCRTCGLVAPLVPPGSSLWDAAAAVEADWHGTTQDRWREREHAATDEAGDDPWTSTPRDARRVDIEVTDELVRLPDCSIKSYDGFALDKSTRYVIEFTREDVRVASHVRIPYAEVHELAVEDRKALKGQGLRLFGGGHGVVGAAEGIALAGAMQAAMTAMTRGGTVVGVEARSGHFVAVHFGSNPRAVRRSVINLYERETLPGGVVEPAANDLTARLVELAGLFERGLLTEEEFNDAKRRVLEGG